MSDLYDLDFRLGLRRLGFGFVQDVSQSNGNRPSGNLTLSPGKMVDSDNSKVCNSSFKLFLIFFSKLDSSLRCKIAKSKEGCL